MNKQILDLKENVNVELIEELSEYINLDKEMEKALASLDKEKEYLELKPDLIDLGLAASSGLVCGLFDAFFSTKDGFNFDFNIEEGKDFARKRVEELVTKVAKSKGYKIKDGDTIDDAVKYLEDEYNMAGDKVVDKFGGGNFHHLRDFSHHPTLLGWFFSILTQFTKCVYGTDKHGRFQVVPLKLEDNNLYKAHGKDKKIIGETKVEKFFIGTVDWFFHLVSDIAGSHDTAFKNGGKGLPGPILSLAHMFSSLPIFYNKETEKNAFSTLVEKYYGGTKLGERDENGKLVKGFGFDLRAELGLGVELAKQSIPVVANEVIVRTFYFLRRLLSEAKKEEILSVNDFDKIKWNEVRVWNSPQVIHMLSVSIAVFETIDIAEAAITKNYLGINYAGGIRLCFSIKDEIDLGLKSRNIDTIKQIYEKCDYYIYKNANDSFDSLKDELELEFNKMTFTKEQEEIVWNIKYHKIVNDIESSKKFISNTDIKELKRAWLHLWQKRMEQTFSDKYTTNDNDKVTLHWFTLDKLVSTIKEMDYEKPWFRLALLDAISFKPYYALEYEINKKGKEVEAKEFKALKRLDNKSNTKNEDKFIDKYFISLIRDDKYSKHIRSEYEFNYNRLNGCYRKLAVNSTIGLVTIGGAVAASIFAPQIAVAIVGTHFPGLYGAALNKACLAYLGGGAIAKGGMGMALGTKLIVGGGSTLSLATGATIKTGTDKIEKIYYSDNDLMKSYAILITAINEIYAKEENDVIFIDDVYNNFLQNYVNLKKDILDLKECIEKEIDKKEKKKMNADLKNMKNQKEVMRVCKDMLYRTDSNYIKDMIYLNE